MDIPRSMSGAASTLPGFRTSAQRLCGALAAASLLACVRQLPPAPPPPPLAPPIQAAAPPPAGHGRLVVDVVDGPAPVQRIHMQPTPIDRDNGLVTYRFTESPEVLCAASPCVADVPAGNVLLGFPVIGRRDATELELVHVGAETSVYRRELSVYEDRTGGLRISGIVAAAIGGTAALTGAALLPIGLGEGHDGLTIAGGITLGVGALVLAIGIWAIRRDAPTFRPGAANHFSLPIGSP